MSTASSSTESFAALGTTIEVGTQPWKREALSLVRQVMVDIDEGCSRFRSDSDLTRVNTNPGRWVPVGPVLIAAVNVAVEASDSTDGLVNPCLGRTLRSLGYDADLGEVLERPGTGVSTAVHTVPRRDAWREVEIDPAGAIRIPADVELDLGATGKAFAADLAALTVNDQLGIDVAVSAGGDVRIVNTSGEPWPIDIAERPEESAHDRVTMVEGGIATSSTTRRRWTQAGIVRHHLIDPRTGQPCSGPWRTVTASGPTATAANTAATAAIVLGDDAVAWLSERGIWGRLVDHSGSVTVVGSEVKAAS